MDAGPLGAVLHDPTAGDELVPHNTGMDYVFVLDISGSMADDGKLRTSRQSLEAFIKGLEKDDRFEIVTFNVAANPLFRQLRPASEDNRRQGEAFLESQQARGGSQHSHSRTPAPLARLAFNVTVHRQLNARGVGAAQRNLQDRQSE